MRDVAIIGIGQVKAEEYWDTSLRDLAYQSIKKALKDADVDNVDALYVGNMLGGELSGQEHLGALISDHCGFNGIEAVRVEAAAASGGAALRQGFLSVASGVHDVVVVNGVEQVTDVLQNKVDFGLALSLDSEYELSSGISLTSLFALLTKRYIHEGRCTPEDLAQFCVNAHKNGVGNDYAMFRREVSADTILKSSVVADPIRMLECPPVCDGSASLVLAPLDNAGDSPVKITGSNVATDTLGLDNREDPLVFAAVRESTKKALEMASKKIEDINFYELHDLFPIVAALSLEASGFARKGEGALLAREGEISLHGKIPITTMGGCKARGNPMGACGVYQAVEAVTQLRNQAGKNQIPCETGMIQCIGGTAATVITHIMEV
ncbi:MAG: thiolase domain-containing protein [Theionarchaea archaeon]|nr:thiolase domain-containing protein [Theionarchaea archaeon]